MARRLPPFELQFATDVDHAMNLPDACERIRSHYSLGPLAKKELSIARVEAVYETAFLRIFLLWEDLLEQSFLRYICGFSSSVGVVALINPRWKTIAHAEAAILGTRDFVSWANPNNVIKRSRDHILKGPHELVLASNLARLEAFASIRNRIAHSSDYARRQFDAATIHLVGRRYPAASPGRFLRDTALVHPVPERWLRHIANELKSLSLQVCP
jgi:hypothetical protein